MEAVARACHELRGPLTAARLGLAAPAGDELPSPGRLRAIDTELGRAALALDDLSGAGGGARRLWRLDRVDVRQVAAECVEAWQATAAAAGSSVRVGWSGEEAAVWGDRLRLAQALGNLVANAVEHGRGPVGVDVAVRGTTVRIEVSDHGPGLPRARRGAQATPAPGAGDPRPWPGHRRRRGRGTRRRTDLRAVTADGARLVLQLPLGPAGAGLRGLTPYIHTRTRSTSRAAGSTASRAPPSEHTPRTEPRVNCKPGPQNAGLHAFLHGCTSLRRTPSHPESPVMARDWRARGRGWARLWGNRCHLGCIVGESGILWASLPEPGWQGSSHPATRVLSFQDLV